MTKLTWIPPKYRQQKTFDNWCPTPDLVKQVINALPKKKSIIAQTLAETGIRGYELERLKWSDVDFERFIIDVKTVKNGNPRILTLTNTHNLMTKNLFARLRKLPKKSDKIFGGYNYYNIRNGYSILRKRLAKDLENPEILKLKWHKFRHYFGTMLYIRSKFNQIKVMKLLGHTSLKNTTIYVHLSERLLTQPQNWIIKIANTNEEYVKLLEQNYEYVSNGVNDEGIVLRKLKE